MSRYSKEKKVALLAVKEACLLARKIQASLQSSDILEKEDLSPVTLADFCIQISLNQALKTNFPDDPLMGEEDSALFQQTNGSFLNKIREEFFPTQSESTLLAILDQAKSVGGATGRFWTLDPIDGTKGFIQQGQYAIALALIEEGRVVVAALGCPRLLEGYVFLAVKGEGAWRISLETELEEPLKIDPSLGSRKEMIYCEPNFHSQKHSHKDAYKIATLLHTHVKPFRLDSQVKYPVVALNMASIYLRITKKGNENIWDHAAGALLVEEAGGKVTDLYGAPLDFSQGTTLLTNTGVIASTGHEHEKIVAAASKVLQEAH